MIKKNPNKVCREGMDLNLIKAINDKPTAKPLSFILSEMLKAFPLRSGTRCPLFPLLFNRVLEVLVTTVRQEKETKGIQIGKK